MKQVYPAFIFDAKDSSDHPFLAYVPDLSVYTQGSDFFTAIEMARDAIGAAGISMEDHGEALPEPSTQEKAIETAKKHVEIVDFSIGTLTYIDVDFTEYRRKTDLRTVRRNVTLPSWLNYEAEHSGINVSRVLQEALMQVLKVQRPL